MPRAKKTEDAAVEVKATAAAPGSGYLTKDVADTLYDPV